MIPAAEVYAALEAAHGTQSWWPAEGAFEIMAGALLVQRTTWRSAESAVAGLRQHRFLDPVRLRHADLALVEACIRSAGFFRSKAVRLRKLAQFVVEQGGMDGLAAKPTHELRAQLLALEGIGPETADAILLYAFDRPAVVVDAYLRRLAQRLTAAASAPRDTRLREWVEAGIGDARRLSEFHALVVEHGKRTCRPVPLCAECAINARCRTGRKATSAQ